MGLERLHGRLRLDLAMFSPWMSKERLRVYLYRDRQAYAGGQFKPPPWSNGVSFYEQRTVVVYDQPDRRKLLDIIAHETTHLLFESYWGEMGRKAPSWLNEGLAMVEEAEPGRPEASEWHRSMQTLPARGYLNLADLVRINPTADLGDDKAKVERWYVQSYSVTYFLLRKHSRLQFKSFCAKLRDGADVDQALWSAFRYQSLAHLQKAWLDWLRLRPVSQGALAR